MTISSILTNNTDIEYQTTCLKIEYQIKVEIEYF